MDMVQKAHFMRRASFGAKLAELSDATPPEDLLATWLNERLPIPTPNLKLSIALQLLTLIEIFLQKTASWLAKNDRLHTRYMLLL